MKTLFQTANSSEMRLSAAICTANIAAVADGEWAMIAPYGEHSAPHGNYVQRFDRSQADKVVANWHSLTGLAARMFKNLRHGLGTSNSVPVWDGHPDDDARRWPREKLLARITDVRAGAEGLEGLVMWNAKTANTRPSGPLYPSVLWLHWPPAGEPPAVYPELLESVGLVTSPNISGVPAWTANANPFADTPAEPADQNIMNPQQLAALARSLNQPESTAPEKLIELAGQAFQLSTANAKRILEQETLLSTANATKAGIETKLIDANDKLIEANHKAATLTGERDTLKTANAALVTETETLRKGVLDLAEKRGVIAPADRADFETRLKTANTAAGALTELQEKKPKLNTQRVEIDVKGTRLDISTANARGAALDAEVAKRVAAGMSYDQAHATVRQDPAFAPLFGAMQDPAKQAAA